MTTIVFAHPWHKSFNKAIVDTIVNTLEANGEAYRVLDLYRDGFNPVMSQEELAVYQSGTALDPRVQSYSKVLAATKRIALVFPIWWYDMPAILRGFFDKVMLEGKAFHGDAEGMHPLLQVESSIVITTSFCTTAQMVEQFGDPVQGTIMRATFPAIGFGNPQWHNLGSIDATTQQEREAFLETVATLFAE